MVRRVLAEWPPAGVEDDPLLEIVDRNRDDLLCDFGVGCDGEQIGFVDRGEEGVTFVPLVVLEVNGRATLICEACDRMLCVAYCDPPF